MYTGINANTLFDSGIAAQRSSVHAGCRSEMPIPFLLVCVAASGTSWRVPDEAGVWSEAVPDSQRLSLCERRHQSPEPAAPIAAGRVRQEAHLTPWRDRHRPVWARGRILLLQVQVGSYSPPSHCLSVIPCPTPCAASPFIAEPKEGFSSPDFWKHLLGWIYLIVICIWPLAHSIAQGRCDGVHLTTWLYIVNG